MKVRTEATESVNIMASTEFLGLEDYVGELGT